MIAGFVGKCLLLLGVVTAAGPIAMLAGLPKVYSQCLGDRPAIFRRANELYEQGRLAEAEAGYRFLIANGAKNGYVHFNLANTHFLRGHLGRAIVEYERALEYLPRNGDIRHNLEFVRNLTVDEELQPKEYGGTLGFILGLHSMLNLRESLILLAVVVWFVAVTYSVGILFPESAATHRTRWIRVGLVAVLIFCILSVGVKAHRLEHRDRAVILAPNSDVKLGRGDDYSTVFSLHEGTTVRAGTQLMGWVQIRLQNLPPGWVKVEDLEVI